MKTLSLFLLAAAAPFAAAAAQPASESTTSRTPASEQAETPAPQAERPAPAQRRICRRIDSTGSRTGGQRVCMTAEEWRRVDL